MALHTFESLITVPDGRFGEIAGYFEQYGSEVPRMYMSLAPTFRVGDSGLRTGEIAFTHVGVNTENDEEEFAGVLFVGDGDKDQRNYDMVLRAGGLVEVDKVPVCSFRTHLVTGKRSDYSGGFTVTSVVRDNLPARGQIRAERKFTKLTYPQHADEFIIKPSNVYDLARMLRPKTR